MVATIIRPPLPKDLLLGLSSILYLWGCIETFYLSNRVLMILGLNQYRIEYKLCLECITSIGAHSRSPQNTSPFGDGMTKVLQIANNFGQLGSHSISYMIVNT